MTLTPARLAVLQAIAESISTRGYAPTFTELAAATGNQSRAAMHAIVGRLEHDGFIRRQVYARRGIEILRMPGDGPPPTEAEIAALAAVLKTAGDEPDFSWHKIARTALEFTRRKERP